ncbi:LysR substrate-binding domain-containing protein [Kordiimonas marina]|uniref:LysR substrate-binding domain-containing protein n=1 Tax=Kordiimonas marina TaxID=2872312 RepID=UPI001FF4EF87|nr:LysR substrate-binding domain-containing protein [Kordiimonas marina]MCJ9427831.1 LysR family transcriptional regulator [Kordiimonas marina]
MKRRIPPLTALECFDAVMRHGQVTRAADELNLTQSAVSRQIGNLEAYVGTALFRRERKRLIATEAAVQYAAALTLLLSQMEAETLRLMAGGTDDKVLTLGLLPTFGSRWLIPRLGGFTQGNPDIQLNIVTGLGPFNFTADGTDVAVQYGSGTWPGVTAHRIMGEEVVAVIAPDLYADGTPLSSYDRLHMTTRPTAWATWADANGLEGAVPVGGPKFENFNMMIEAVRSGLGVAVLPLLYIADDLKTGRLIAPFGAPAISEQAYYLVYPDTQAASRKIALFRDWILGTANA